ASWTAAVASSTASACSGDRKRKARSTDRRRSAAWPAASRTASAADGPVERPVPIRHADSVLLAIAPVYAGLCRRKCELEDGGGGSEREPRLGERGLASRQPLQREAGPEQRPQGATARRLDELPELHRHGERDEEHDERRPHRERERPERLR